MRRFFFFLVLISAITAFVRSDLADDLFGHGGYSMTGWFNKISESAEERVINNFKEDAAPIMAGLTEEQAKYTGHVMKDRETLGVFYLRYCKGDDINPYIFGTNLEEFCDLIDKAEILSR